MNRFSVLILIAVCLVLVPVGYFTTASVFASNLEGNVAVHKATAQVRRASQRGAKRGLQKDVELAQMRLDAQYKMITDLTRRINDITASAKRYATLITIILFFIIGLSSWFVAGRRAEMSAKKWMDDRAADFRKEIESLRETFRYNIEKMQKEADPSGEATMHIRHESMTVKETAFQEQGDKALSNKEARLGQLQRNKETMPVSDEAIKRGGSSLDATVQEVDNAHSDKEASLGQSQRNKETMPVSDESIKRNISSMDLVLQEQAAMALNSKGLRLLIKAKQTWDNEIEREKLLRNALVCFDESLRKKNNYSIALGNKGYVLFLMDRIDDAKESLHAALKSGREDLKNAELENAANSTVPADTAFRELIARLWDELNVK
jgi:tetratricopeptide (TPR) repeat protein